LCCCYASPRPLTAFDPPTTSPAPSTMKKVRTDSPTRNAHRTLASSLIFLLVLHRNPPGFIIWRTAPAGRVQWIRFRRPVPPHPHPTSPISANYSFVNLPHACYRRGPKQKFSQPAQTSSFMATLQAKRNVFDQRLQQGFDVNDPKSLSNLKSSTLSALGRSPAASSTHSPTTRQPPLSKGGGGSAASAFASKNYSSSSEDDVAHPVPPPPLTT
jgi:hypothetical protein